MSHGDWQGFLTAQGFNMFAWLRVEDIDAPEGLLPPWARSMCLVGSGGQALWGAFQRFLLEHPDWLDRADPLDDYTTHSMTHLLQELGPPHPTELSPLSQGGRCEVFYPFTRGAVLDFVELASLAGWGRSGPLGLAVHPVFGPWYGLRAAFVFDFACPEEALARPIGSICDGCEAPCVHACPVRAVTRAGWDTSLCFAWRRSEADCKERCHSRLACPIGTEHQYTKAQLAFHMRHILKWLEEGS